MHLDFGHVEFNIQPSHTRRIYRLQKYVLDWINLRYCPLVGFDMNDIKLLGCVVRKTDMNRQLICSSPQT